MASKENPFRKVFDGKPMIRPMEGTKEKLGRCLVEKSEKSAPLDTKNSFTIIAEQIAYVICTFFSNLKSNVALFSSAPVFSQNMHLYHVYEDDSYVGNM